MTFGCRFSGVGRRVWAPGGPGMYGAQQSRVSNIEGGMTILRKKEKKDKKWKTDRQVRLVQKREVNYTVKQSKT